MRDHDTDLLIVGAGPTGLAAGCDALRHGLTVRLIERRTTRALESKALVLHARTMEVFEALGCADAVLEAGQKFRALHVRPAPHLRPIRVDLIERPWGDTRYPFWLSVPQYEVERALERRFVAAGGRLEWGTSLEDLKQDAQGVEVTLSTGRHRAQWVLGCDGGRSQTRQLVGLTLPREGLGVSFALTDIWVKSDLIEDEGHVVLTPDGVLLIVPMPERGQWRLIAQVTAAFDTSSIAAWRALVEQRAGFDLPIERLGWHSQFDLTGGVANRFRAGQVFLLGDAAHVHSPVGGQGLNTGAQDAHNLVWKLALLKREALRIDEQRGLLESYEAERRPIALEMVRMTGLATRVLTLTNPLARAVRGVVGRVMVHRPGFQDRLARGVGMLDVLTAGAPRLENPVLPDGRRLHELLDPLRPTRLVMGGRARVVRPDRVVARAGLIPETLATRVEVN